MMKDFKCKGAEPALLPVVLDPAAAAAMKERNVQPGGKAYNEIMDKKMDYQKNKQAKKDPETDAPEVTEE